MTMEIYVINDEIEFRVEEKMLISLTEPELSALLTTPASKCLILLLNNAPEVISHDDLLQKVWGESGVIVPLNTLHQSISSVRRALKNINKPDIQLIVAVPKHGFKIPSSISIKKNNGNINKLQGNVFLHKLAINNHKEPLYKNTLTFLTCILLGFALAFLTKYILSFYSDRPYGVQYHLTKDGCHVYSNARINYEARENTYILSKINKSEIECRNHPWVYIYSFKASSVSTAIACKKKISSINKNNCISMYFMGRD